MRFVHAVTGVALLAALAGCESSSRFDPQPSSAAPAPLAPQPIGGVQSSGLSAPPGTAGDLNANQFPAAPTAPTAQVATANAAPPANSMDVTKAQMLGSWKVASGGTSCNMFLTLTKFGNFSRGGTNRCVGELTTMRSWDVNGKQIVLMDANGNPVGHLFKTADNQFSGSTNSGVQISVTR